MRQAAFTQIASSLPLGWSHYVELLTLEDPSERSFYEIEAASNQWSVREPSAKSPVLFTSASP